MQDLRLPRFSFAVAQLAALLAAGAGHAQALSDVPTVEELAHRIGVISDMNEIERFHHIYGYQQDYMLYYAQADLSSRDARHHYKYGVYEGLEGARRLWVNRWGSFTGYADMPIFGSLIDHHQAQGFISVAPDRRSAKARFRTSADRFYTRAGQDLANASQAAQGAEHSVWYENEYVREDGMWKLRSLRVCIYAEGTTRGGYADLPVPGKLGTPIDADPDYWKTLARTDDEPGDWNVLYPDRADGPDRVESPEEYGCFFAKNQTMIRSVVLPFSFDHPVTGKPVRWKNK